MDIFNVLNMLGGLALFLYGMNAMGDGLAKVSGGRLESVLEKLTKKRIMAVLLGAAVTAVIQSSSATTVMVVGFVNSGIMKLNQAIGIIMGANIGTTITSWILALTGIQSDNIFVSLLKPSSFSPILAVIGAAFILFSKKDRKKDIGTIMVGFAILMFGMETMSAAVKPLANVPQFTNMFTMFTNPVLGMIVGAVLTAVIQSSSASVGILQALCATGGVTMASAIPIIMGQNIGTCVTSLISAAGANKNAKRAALVHFYFNLIGTIIFMVVFYTLNAFLHFEILNMTANAWLIALVHSCFNIAATILFMPFGDLLAKLACLTIRDKKETNETTAESDSLEKDFQVLDPRFLESPAFAVQQCKNVAVKMANSARDGLFLSMELLESYDEEKAGLVLHYEDIVDRYEDELGTYLVKLNGKSLTKKDSQIVSMLLHVIGDFERISDHAVNIKEAAEEMRDKKLKFSDKAAAELKVYTTAIHEIVNMAFDAFTTENVEAAGNVEPLEEVMDYLKAELKDRHVRRLRKGKCTIELGFVLTDLITNYERVADHCSNIAVCLIQVVGNDGFDTHEYLDNIKSKDNEEFKIKVHWYKEKYELP
ncbi:na/Pi-cotransporter [Firmicutes bacterium CAG:882]|nr:na/Pi-cotransporter [Firmicutes bacterium CAG:882]